MNATTGGATFDDAEASCVTNGGHLVAYQSLDEHKDVEQHFITYGYFLPESHKVEALASNSHPRCCALVAAAFT